MDQEIKKSCWGVTFWAVMAFVVALSVAYLVKQGNVKHSASIATQSQTNVQ